MIAGDKLMDIEASNTILGMSSLYNPGNLKFRRLDFSVFKMAASENVGIFRDENTKWPTRWTSGIVDTYTIAGITWRARRWARQRARTTGTAWRTRATRIARWTRHWTRHRTRAAWATRRARSTGATGTTRHTRSTIWSTRIFFHFVTNLIAHFHRLFFVISHEKMEIEFDGFLKVLKIFQEKIIFHEEFWNTSSRDESFEKCDEKWETVGQGLLRFDWKCFGFFGVESGFFMVLEWIFLKWEFDWDMREIREKWENSGNPPKNSNF